MAVSKAQQRAVSKYMKENYDEIKVRIAKGEKEVIKTHAEAHNESVNAFINRAIQETIERDNATTEEV
jgi:predicted HicB family RNase H-like nuclease